MLDVSTVARPTVDIADIFRHHFKTYTETSLVSALHYKIATQIMNCRTAVLGGHLYQCQTCKNEVNAYNSCRNRHCPKCQGSARRKWVAAREAELLPVHYFHVVFTMPGQFAPLALQNKQVLYDILFEAGGKALLDIGADPRHLGADLGYIAVLHTWGQNLLHHPHIHCIVPGGGISPDGKTWIATRSKFLLPVRVLSKHFRTLFLKALMKAFQQGRLAFHGQLKRFENPAAFQALLKSTCRTDWVVYAKPPFGSPQQVLRYIGRYTHRVAISNSRLRQYDGQSVTFEHKDYRRGRSHLLMTLPVQEFMRRFLLHVQPIGFVRIRYGGFMANRNRTARLELCRTLIHTQPSVGTTSVGPTNTVEISPQHHETQDDSQNASPKRHCSKCNTATMRPISIIPSQLATGLRKQSRRRQRRPLRSMRTWRDPVYAPLPS
jgi:hypothetical protein